MDLLSCIPVDKFDETAVNNAAELGFPGLNPILPELLEWMQDCNWPVAQDLAPVLATAGPEIAPPIIAIFASDDEQWKFSLLVILIDEFRPEIRRLLTPELKRLAERPTQSEQTEEVDVLAAETLANWHAQTLNEE